MLSRDSRLVTVKDAAQILSMNEQVLYRMAADGRLPTYRIGKAVRFDLDELSALLRNEGSEESCNVRTIG
ncbi:MAG TPA: helix-turn-helix domain-containing protein [Candidatus Aquicultor sp.]|jgi:excisionase family DNA binding protein